MNLKPVLKVFRNQKTTLSLRLLDETFNRLQIEADAVGISMSEAVRQLIDQYLATKGV